MVQLRRHRDMVLDILGRKQNTYLMLMEENRSADVMIKDICAEAEDQKNIAWLKKVIQATKIQSADAAKSLEQLESKFIAVKRNSNRRRL